MTFRSIVSLSLLTSVCAHEERSCQHKHVHAYTHACTRTCTHAHMHAHARMCVHASMHVRAHVQAYVRRGRYFQPLLTESGAIKFCCSIATMPRTRSGLECILTIVHFLQIAPDILQRLKERCSTKALLTAERVVRSVRFQYAETASLL